VSLVLVLKHYNCWCTVHVDLIILLYLQTGIHLNSHSFSRNTIRNKIKAFNSRSTHISVSNVQFSQIMQKWHSLRFYIARIGVTETRDLICILKLGRELIHLSCENVARIDQFSPANNSFVLLSRTIVSVYTIIFRLSGRVYVLFRFQIGELSDILRCDQYGGQPHNEAAFFVASCTRCHAQSRDHAQRSNWVTWCSLHMQVGRTKLFSW